MNTKQLIQVRYENMGYATPYFTLHEQDSDSRFYDDKAASRVVEQIYIDSKFGDMREALVVSRTRIEFTGEHTVWADSEYLKSLGNEDNIYSNFIKSQGV
tara:strand:- start:215 stop:514 length:300 start_codon:yes stop_codon:yes gene_type:complete